MSHYVVADAKHLTVYARAFKHKLVFLSQALSKVYNNNMCI